jgi:putative ABC transport system substrate-binding protein
MMDRRAFVTAVGGSILGARLAAEAQPGEKIYRIGILENRSAASNAANLGAFLQGLKELGYVEEQDFVIEYRSADGRPERFADLAAEMVRLDIDVIVTSGTPAALAAKRATRTIPIVMASGGEPAVAGIVTSLARPGGNVTGLYVMAPAEVGAQRVQLLKAAVPRLSQVSVLWNAADMQTPLIMRETQKAARGMRLQLTSLEISRRIDSLDQLFETAILGRTDALVVIEDLVTVTYRSRILDFAAMSRLPAIYPLREFADEGGLMSYGADRRDLYRRAAGYVHRIFKGARPADLPVEPSTRFELVINLKTAKALGLTIPQTLLLRADQIIQ